jgi:hypothetical protein
MGIPGDMQPGLQSRDPIAKLVLHAKQEAIAPEAGIILGLAEAGLRGGRGSAIPRIPHRPTLFVSVAAFLQDAFLDMDSGCAQARPACPYHDHPVHPTLMNGDAWWTCPRREGALPGVGKPRGPESRLREPDLRTAGRTFVCLNARSTTEQFGEVSTTGDLVRGGPFYGQGISDAVLPVTRRIADVQGTFGLVVQGSGSGLRVLLCVAVQRLVSRFPRWRRGC